MTKNIRFSVFGKILVSTVFAVLLLGAICAIGASVGTDADTCAIPLSVTASIDPPMIESGKQAIISIFVANGTDPVANAEVHITLDADTVSLGGKADPAAGLAGPTGQLNSSFLAPITSKNMTSTIIIKATKPGFEAGIASLTVTITGNGSPPPVDEFYLKLEPKFVSMAVGENRMFEAHGYLVDANGTATQVDGPKTWNALGGIGKIEPDPVNNNLAKFTASMEGYGQVTARMEYMGKVAEAQAEVTVCSSGSGNATMKLVITPVGASLVVGETSVFQAQAYDGAMNPIKTAVYGWSVTGGIGKIDLLKGPQTTFTATAKGYGQVVVVAESGSLKATASAEVNVMGEGGSDYILVITPEKASLPVGATQAFEAQVYDSSKNPVTKLEYMWDTVGGIGTISPLEGQKTIFTATGEGYGQVMVKVNCSGKWLKGESEIWVGEHTGDGYNVVITPEKVMLKVGATQTFTAQAYDASGSPIMGIKYLWEVESSKIGDGTKGMPEPVLNIGKISDNGTFTAINPGYGYIHASFKDSTGKFGIGTANVLVEPIEGADLGVFSIGFSSKAPMPGETVILYALVNNFGTESATGTVTFYEGNSTVGKPQKVYVIPGYTDIAFVEWNAVNGTHKFCVKISSTSPADKNPHNDVAYAGLEVGKSVTPPDIKVEYSIKVTKNDTATVIDIELVIVCGKDPVHKIRIVIWDSAGLTIELSISESFDMKAGEVKKMHLRITLKNGESIDREISVQAVGNETSSGVATIPVQAGAPPAGGFAALMTAQNIALILAGAGAGVGLAAALFFRSRHGGRRRKSSSVSRSAVHSHKKRTGP